jgi:hypothetical protein
VCGGVMKRVAIRNYGSLDPNPQRFCDAVYEDGELYLEKKENKKYVKIPWEDVKYQVEKFEKNINKMNLSR